MFFSYVDFVRFRALSCADFSPEQNASFWWPWLMNLYDFEAPKMARSWESLTFLIDFEANSMVSAWFQLPFQEICSRVLATLFVHFRALSCALAFVGFAGAERPISLDFSIFAKIVVMEVVSSPIMANHAGKQ